MSEINRYGISGGAAVQVASGYFPEGQSPSSLNDGSRTIMADVRRYVEQTTPETTATYSGGVYTLSLTRDLSAGELTQGFTAAFIAGSTNSASATLNINSTGAKNLLDNAGTHIVGEAIQNHQPVNVVYDKKKDGYRVMDQTNTIFMELNLKNSTSEDTSGGRESQVVFKGLQSGGEESTLVKIQASHEGTSDDEKGQLIVGVNDGNDGSSPTTAVTVASTGIVTFDKMPITPNPTFRVYRNSDQTGISDASFTKVQFDTVAYDARNEYDESTNYRYSPTIAGVYSFFAGVRVGGSVGTWQCFLALYKNGSKVLQVNNRISSSDDLASAIPQLAVHDTTDGDDYYEIFVYLNTNGSNGSLGGSSSGFNTYFGGTLLSRTT